MSKLYSLRAGLKKARKAAHLSQQELADLFGYSLKTIQNWEQGLVAPDLEDIMRLADLLKCDIDFLTGRISCPTHDIQFIHDKTGLSVDAINRLGDLKDCPIDILSSIITDREFVELMRSIDTLSKANFNQLFYDSVRAYLVSRFEDSSIKLPYMDSPEDIRAVFQHQPLRHFENILDRVTSADVRD